MHTTKMVLCWYQPDTCNSPKETRTAQFRRNMINVAGKAVPCSSALGRRGDQYGRGREMPGSKKKVLRVNRVYEGEVLECEDMRQTEVMQPIFCSGGAKEEGDV